MVPACRRPPNTPAQRGEGEVGAANRAPPTAAPPALLTWHVWGLLQAVVGAAVLGALHKVGRLIHVLGKARRSPHCWGSGGGGGEGRWGRSCGAALTTHDPHAVEGHLLVEVPHHVVPPLVRLRIGEVWESCGARPHLQEGQCRAEPRPHPRHPSGTPGCTPPSHHSPQPPLSPHTPGQGCAPHTFPMSGCPVALRMNTPRFSPSS